MNLVVSIVFLLMGLVGIWTAYAPVSALTKFYLLSSGVVGAHFLGWICRIYGERLLSTLSIFCAVAASLLGLLAFLPNLAPSEVIAGALIILLPLGASGAVWLWRQQEWMAAGTVALLLAWALVALVRTGERSAWLGLGVGACAGIFLVWRQGIYQQQSLGRWVDGLLATAIVVGVALYTGAVLAQGVPQWFPFADKFTVQDHFELWGEGLVMIRDYPFSGSGLTTTPMVFSSYVYPLHVPLVEHVHNLYLQVAIDQGVPGLLAFLGIAVVALRTLVSQAEYWHQDDSENLIWRTAALVALAAMLTHGLLDSGLYASRLAPILFLPFGFAASMAQLDVDGAEATYRNWTLDEIGMSRNTPWLLQIIGGVMALAVIVGLTVLPGTRAAFQANLGTIVQTRAELTRYRWPGWWNQDEMRRANPALLDDAIRYYESALRIDAGNSTAHRRLGQIALSLGHYPDAVTHLEQAFMRAPQQRVNAYLLGEAYAVTGHVEEAARLWDAVGWNINQLTLRQQWYQYIGAEQEAAWMEEAIADKENAIHH